MDDMQARIDRLAYYTRPTEEVSHDPLIDDSDECSAKQYEWREEHESLGGGNFLRKPIIGDELTDGLY